MDHDGDYGSGRFCSSKCARSYSTKQKRGEINKKVSDALTGRTRAPRSPASNKTRKKISVGNKKAHLKKAEKIISMFPSEKWTRGIRRYYLFKTRGTKCEKCLFEYKIKKIGFGPFEIHHIDGNHENNKIENLMILCKNCHWETPNYGFRERTHTKKVREKLKKQNYKKKDFNGVYYQIKIKDLK